ncbi:MAG: hypothetical protein ACYCV7_12450 [Acidimicrobiales bacterium]
MLPVADLPVPVPVLPAAPQLFREENVRGAQHLRIHWLAMIIGERDILDANMKMGWQPEHCVR